MDTLGGKEGYYGISSAGAIYDSKGACIFGSNTEHDGRAEVKDRELASTSPARERMEVYIASTYSPAHRLSITVTTGND